MLEDVLDQHITTSSTKNDGTLVLEDDVVELLVVLEEVHDVDDDVEVEDEVE